MSLPPDPLPREAPVPVDEALTALSDSETLALLGMTGDDLKRAGADPTFLETLRITHQVLGALRDEGVLGVFLLLPYEDQANFVRWIATIDQEAVRRALTDTFVLSLKESPLGAG